MMGVFCDGHVHITRNTVTNAYYVNGIATVLVQQIVGLITIARNSCASDDLDDGKVPPDSRQSCVELITISYSSGAAFVVQQEFSSFVVKLKQVYGGQRYDVRRTQCFV